MSKSEITIELEYMANELGTHSHNAGTAEPIFIVQERVIDYGISPDYCEHFVWLDAEDTERVVTEANDAALFQKLEKGVFDGEEEGRREMWSRVGIRERWNFVQPFLTRAAAEQFMRGQAHNMVGPTRIYVESAHNNTEWKWLRSRLERALPEALRERDELVAFVKTHDVLDPYARFVLSYFRLPAAQQVAFFPFMGKHRLFCTYGDQRYRVTGASRLGDVWLIADFKRDSGYDHRVNVTECSAWGPKP